jgi:hypothetical protein
MASPTPSKMLQLRRSLVAALTDQLPAKFSALFFAVVLWVIVRSEEPVEAWIDVHLALTLDSAVTVSGPTPPVQALVSGRGRELLKLYGARPIIRRSVGEDDSVFAVHPSDVFTANEADVRVLDVRPHLVRLPLQLAPSRGALR